MKHIFPILLILLLLLSGCADQPAAPVAPPMDLSTGAVAPAPAVPDSAQTTEIPAPVVPTPSVEPETAPETPPAEEPVPVEPIPEEPAVRTIDPSRPMVALTFDDGPYDVCSNAILDILEEHNSSATFFEVAKNVYSYPEVLVRMDEMGCEIGSHSYGHADLSLLSQASLLADLDKADKAFISAIGKAPTLVRPPYGAVNKSVKSTTGRSMILWTVDTNDWKYRDAETIINYVQSLPSLDGEIVLMHSLYESTVEAVRVLVPWLIEQGYQLVTISELITYYYGDTLTPNEFYGYSYFSAHDRTASPVEGPAPTLYSQVPAEEHNPPVIITNAPAPQPAAPAPEQTPAEPTPTLPEETAPSTPPVEDVVPPPAEEVPTLPDDPALPPEESSPTLPDAPPAEAEPSAPDSEPQPAP